MKICPDCQERYGDDVAVCPTDGEELVDLPDELSGNPKLQEPVPAAPADRTSMIDLEAMEAKRAAKKAAKAAEAGEVVDEEKTPPPEGPEEVDRDATGTMQRTGSSKKRKKKDPTQLPVEEEQVIEQEDQFPEDRRVNEELTDREMSRTGKSRSRMSRVDKSQVVEKPSGTRTGMTRNGTRAGTQMKPAPKKRALSGVQAAFLVIFGLSALVAGIVFVARATAVLTVTTVPPGAVVVVDGKKLGLSPLQKRMRTGSHVIELSLDDYEPYKEVVDVPAGGLPFLQPLQKKPPPPPPPPTPAQIAVDMAKAAEMMFNQGDLEGSKKKLEEALKLSSACAECAALLPKVDEAIRKRDGDKAREEASGAREARLRQARVLNEEGRRAYESNQLGAAKEKLYASLKLDPENPEPHRTLGRIFNREDEVEKVRYHLQRYLDLGGADSDFKVREWLKSHPK